MAGAGGLFMIGAVALVASAALSGLTLPVLKRYGVFDRPNERSLHMAATPRGGGAAAVLVVLALWAWLGWPLDRGDAVTIAAALMLAGIGALDDLKELDWRLRLAAQAFAVGLPGTGLGPYCEIADLRVFRVFRFLRAR